MKKVLRKNQESHLRVSKIRINIINDTKMRRKRSVYLMIEK